MRRLRLRNAIAFGLTLALVTPATAAQAAGVAGVEDQALLARDGGDAAKALELWTQASSREEADGFVWNQRAWSELAAGRAQRARESFEKAIERSAATASQAEAGLGLGLAALALGRPKDGMEPLRAALVQGPAIMPAASYLTALTALAQSDKWAARAYLRQGLDLDPLNLESLKELARLDEKLGEKRSAWSLFQKVSALDRADEDSARRARQLSEALRGDLAANPDTRRLPRPLLDPEGKGAGAAPASTETLRVSLFSDEEGRSALAHSLDFAANSAFRIIPQEGPALEGGRAFDSWEASWNPETRAIELRDSARNLKHFSKEPVRLEPLGPFGSMLVKNARFSARGSFDAGDRELRGSLEIVPALEGFQLVNIVKLEEYLYGAVGAAIPQGAPPQAARAQAIVSRTIALEAMQAARRRNEPTDLCDSDFCQKYIGVNAEMREAAQAAAATEGLILALDGRPARVARHENCGGFTETGLSPGLEPLVAVSDTPEPLALPGGPAALERWIHGAAPAAAYCATGRANAASRWIRLLDARELEARARRLKEIGPLLGITIARRGPNGRVEALEARGKRGSLILEGEKAVSQFLSPSSLRSTLFSIQPLGPAARPERFILWGAGTGHGLGLCAAGAAGQAERGRDWKQILGHYFPRLKVLKR